MKKQDNSSPSADLENNQLKEEMEAEKDSTYIKMDWTLKSPEERVAKVNEIIANTPPEKLTPYYLEKLSKYIVYPIEKSERKQKYILTDNRLTTINKRETSYEGLITKFENGEDGLYNITINDKDVLLDMKDKITEEDIETIPGLKELREAIEKMKIAEKKATGKKRYYLKKQIIQMLQDQYVIKAAFKQTTYSRNLSKILSRLTLDEEIYLDADGKPHSTATISLLNPAHVVALLCNYSELKMETWDKFNADMRWVLLDLEKLIEEALKEKNPLLYKLLIYKIDKKTNAEIQLLLKEEFGIEHSIEYLSSLWRRKIPKLIVEQAELDWLDWYYTYKEKGHWKKCNRCGQVKLAHNKFFSKNHTSKDGFYSICKACRNKEAKEKRLRG